MSQVVISIDLTVGNNTNTVQIQSIKDSQGNDISTQFYDYCKKNSLPLSSQQDLESAASKFSQDNASWLP